MQLESTAGGQMPLESAFNTNDIGTTRLSREWSAGISDDWTVPTGHSVSIRGLPIASPFLYSQEQPDHGEFLLLSRLCRP